VTARGRIIPASAAQRGEPLLAPRAGAAAARRVAREELDARLAAERVMVEARDKDMADRCAQGIADVVRKAAA